MPFSPGTVIGGRYRITRLLGQGEVAEVYAAQRTDAGTEVALKVLAPALATSSEYMARFVREAEILGHLKHPNIVEIIEAGRSKDGYCIIAMELLQGETLAAALKGGPIHPSLALVLLEQLLGALETAHAAGIVHRDVRPENIHLVAGPDGRPTIKMLDFGVARVLEDVKHLTAFGTMLGSPEYAPPEQMRGQKVDARADLYAVGCVGFAMLAGVPPFQGENRVALIRAHMTQPVPRLVDRRPGLAAPPGMDEWIGRALAKEPDKRFPDATQMRMTLARIRTAGDLPASGPAKAEVIPLGGEVLPGYVDLAGAPSALPFHESAPAAAVPRPAAAPRPATAPIPTPAPPPAAAPAAPGPAAAAPAGGPWKALAIGAIVLVVLLAVVLALVLGR